MQQAQMDIDNTLDVETQDLHNLRQNGSDFVNQVDQHIITDLEEEDRHNVMSWEQVMRVTSNEDLNVNLSLYSENRDRQFRFPRSESINMNTVKVQHMTMSLHVDYWLLLSEETASGEKAVICAINCHTNPGKRNSGLFDKGARGHGISRFEATVDVTKYRRNLSIKGNPFGYNIEGRTYCLGDTPLGLWHLIIAPDLRQDYEYPINNTDGFPMVRSAIPAHFEPVFRDFIAVCVANGKSSVSVPRLSASAPH